MTTTERQAEIESIAAAHLAGIEGGLAGAVHDYRQGVPLDAAAGIGDSWDLPDGIALDDVLAAVRRQVIEAGSEDAPDLGEAAETSDTECAGWAGAGSQPIR
jgi:hypothetical protein